MLNSVRTAHPYTYADRPFRQERHYMPLAQVCFSLTPNINVADKEAGLCSAAVPVTRHSGMFLVGLNLPGADLNSQRLARRAAYMDVCCIQWLKTLDACVTSDVLPFALRASLWLFKIAPGDFVAGITSLFRAAVVVLPMLPTFCAGVYSQHQFAILCFPCSIRMRMKTFHQYVHNLFSFFQTTGHHQYLP